MKLFYSLLAGIMAVAMLSTHDPYELIRGQILFGTFLLAAVIEKVGEKIKS